MCPVALVHPVNTDALTGRRRVDETAISKIDTDVRNSLAVDAEEDQIASLHVIACYTDTGAKLADRVGRKIDAQGARKHKMDEATAIKAGGRAAAAAAITYITLIKRQFDEQLPRIIRLGNFVLNCIFCVSRNADDGWQRQREQRITAGLSRSE